MNAAATACRERTRSLFEDDLSEDAGVLQVVSCWRTPMGGARVIAINASAPASPTDRFVLHLARSRADAIVTTGNILRAEPKLSHGVAGPAKDRAELDAWRRECLGRSASPLSLVLTSGEGLDLDHSLFKAGNPCVIYTGEDAAKRLRAAGSERGIEVVGRPTPSLRNALTWLREEREARTVSIEAGPTTTLPLYEEPIAIREIMLSIYEEPELTEAARGPLFLDPGELEARGFEAEHRVSLQEPSGRWSFGRLLRHSS